VQRSGWQLRVEADEGVAQALRENDLAVIGPLGRRHAGRDVGAVGDPPTDPLEPGERGVFDGGFAEGASSHSAWSCCEP